MGIDTKSLICSTTLSPSDIGIIEKNPEDINESKANLYGQKPMLTLTNEVERSQVRSDN